MDEIRKPVLVDDDEYFGNVGGLWNEWGDCVLLNSMPEFNCGDGEQTRTCSGFNELSQRAECVGESKRSCKLSCSSGHICCYGVCSKGESCGFAE